jgi:hypothetical protein
MHALPIGLENAVSKQGTGKAKPTGELLAMVDRMLSTDEIPCNVMHEPS